MRTSKWALELEADRMVNSHVWKKDLDTEMTVVRNAVQAGENSPQSVLIKRVLAAAYQEQNYRHLPIGARSDIENAPIERLQAFYRRYYQPDNAVLTVTGKMDEAKVARPRGVCSAQSRNPRRDLIPTYTNEPMQDGERSAPPPSVRTSSRCSSPIQCRPRRCARFIGDIQIFGVIERIARVSEVYNRREVCQRAAEIKPDHRRFFALTSHNKDIPVTAVLYYLYSLGMQRNSASEIPQVL